MAKASDEGNRTVEAGKPMFKLVLVLIVVGKPLMDQTVAFQTAAHSTAASPCSFECSVLLQPDFAGLDSVEL